MSTIILAYVALAYVLWVLFVAVMAFKAAWNRLSPLVKAFALPVAVIAILLDIIFNALMSIPLLELPQEWTFSQRMGRYMSWSAERPKVWKVRLARWVCYNVLDPFEVGGHCR